MKSPLVRRLSALVAFIGVFTVGNALLIAPAVRADCIPCVWVQNDDPYFYAEVCPPLR